MLVREMKLDSVLVSGDPETYLRALGRDVLRTDEVDLSDVRYSTDPSGLTIATGVIRVAVSPVVVELTVDGWRATCSTCEWCGFARPAASAAQDDAETHRHRNHR